MLGFGKKKKKVKEAAGDKKSKEKPDKENVDPEAPSPKKKKKRFSLKGIFISLAVLVVISGSAFFAYTWFFSPSDPDERVYKKVDLAHVSLPEEMLAFSFSHYPEVYDALLAFDLEMGLYEKEVARIAEIAQKYPEQKKIADKEKKNWEKGMTKLAKDFSKLEKPIKETYVLFRVNPEAGLAKILEKRGDLASAANSALKTSREQTDNLRAMEPKIPEGFFKGSLYKLKKKFL